MKWLGKISLVQAFRFRAPALGYPIPKVIGGGLVSVEAMIGGGVFVQSKRDKSEQRFGRGAVFCHFPGERTIYKSDLADPYHCISLQFSGSGVLKGVLPPHFCWSDMGMFDSFMEELLRAYHTQPADRPRLACRTLGEFVWQMRTGQNSAVDDRPEALLRALTIVETRFAELRSMGDLARLTGVSVPTLHRAFRTDGEGTAWDLISRRKLREARYLLSSSFLSIKEVAFQSGYQSFEHFCRTFHEDCGQSPRQYRNAVRSGRPEPQRP